LQDAPGGACILLAGRDCTVQPVKPQQCRDFPNGWSFPGFEKICRALPTEVGDAGAPARAAATVRNRRARGSGRGLAFVHPGDE
jgi:Fe-S-cluster containining protein